MKTYWIKGHVNKNATQIQFTLPIEYYEGQGGQFYKDKETGKIVGEIVQLQGDNIQILPKQLELPIIRKIKGRGRPKKIKKHRGRKKTRDFKGYNRQ